MRPLALLLACALLPACSGEEVVFKPGAVPTAVEFGAVELRPAQPEPFVRPQLVVRARNVELLRAMATLGDGPVDTLELLPSTAPDDFGWVGHEATLPPMPATGELRYWLLAEGRAGDELAFPPGAPAEQVTVLASPPELPAGYAPGDPPAPSPRHCAPDWPWVEANLECAGGGAPFPTLLEPVFVPESRATAIANRREGIGVELAGGEALFFPLSIMLWHEGVNFSAGGQRWFLSYCPLTMSTVLQDTGLDPGNLPRNPDYVITGGLFNSNLVLGRFEGGTPTPTVYPQLVAYATNGPDRGRCLDIHPSVLTTWDAWRALHPQSLLLEEDPNYPEYNYLSLQNPYEEYWQANSEELRAPLCSRDDRLQLKELVLGAWTDPPLAVVLEARTAATNFGHAGRELVLLQWSQGNSAWLFERTLGGEVLELRDAGFRWQGLPMFVDDGAEPSYWTPEGACVAGPREGQRLRWVPSTASFWLGWAAAWPGTRLLDPTTGADR